MADLIILRSTSSMDTKKAFPPPSCCILWSQQNGKRNSELCRGISKTDLLWCFNQDQDLQLIRESKLRHEMSEREATSGEHLRLMVFHGTWGKMLLRKVNGVWRNV